MEENFFKDMKNSIRNAANKASDKIDEWTDRDNDDQDRLHETDRDHTAADRRDTQSVGYDLSPTADNDVTRASLESGNYHEDRDEDNAATRGTLGASSGFSALGDELEDMGNDSRQNVSSDYSGTSSSRFQRDDSEFDNRFGSDVDDLDSDTWRDADSMNDDDLNDRHTQNRIDDL